LDSKKKKDDAIENKYLFELSNRWTIDGSVRENVARYINHACKPNAESDVRPRKRKVYIRAIKKIEPGEEINYDYGTDYFKAYLKPIGCKCDACTKARLLQVMPAERFGSVVDSVRSFKIGRRPCDRASAMISSSEISNIRRPAGTGPCLTFMIMVPPGAASEARFGMARCRCC